MSVDHSSLDIGGSSDQRLVSPSSSSSSDPSLRGPKLSVKEMADERAKTNVVAKKNKRMEYILCVKNDGKHYL